MKTLFHGQHDGGISHYRTKLPAVELDADVALFNVNGKLIETNARGNDHNVVIMQMPNQVWHRKQMLSMQEEGKLVFANVDDYLQSLKNMKGKHAFAGEFNKETVGRHESILRMADGIICSTPWLAKKLRSLNPNVQVARNGVDAERYERVDELDKDMPPIIGWAGGTGHLGAFQRILGSINTVMDLTEAHFLTVGDPLSQLVNAPNDRCHHLPWTDLYDYHRSMQVIDIILAPAEDNNFYRAKSQLRLYEAGILGIPVLAHPMYDELEDGSDGFLCADEHDWTQHMLRLVEDRELRSEMARSIQQHARNEWTIEARKEEWVNAIQTLRTTALQKASA